MRTMILLFVAVLGVSSSYGGQNPLSVCDIMHPKGLPEQSVQVAARILFTMHGAFLTTDSCSDHSYDIVILYPGIEGTPPVSFKLDPEATERLSPFFRRQVGRQQRAAYSSGRCSIRVISGQNARGPDPKEMDSRPERRLSGGLCAPVSQRNPSV